MPLRENISADIIFASACTVYQNFRVCAHVASVLCKSRLLKNVLIKHENYLYLSNRKIYAGAYWNKNAGSWKGTTVIEVHGGDAVDSEYCGSLVQQKVHCFAEKKARFA